MNEQDETIEERLEEIRRKSAVLREHPDDPAAPEERASERRGPSFSAWRPLVRGHSRPRRLTDVDPERDAPGGSYGTPGAGRWSPRCDVFERGDALIVRLELPGTDPKDVEVHVDGQLLVVEGEREDDRPEDRRADPGYGRFQREIALPYPVNPADVRGTFRNGVLEVAITRAGRTARRKRIEIEA